MKAWNRLKYSTTVLLALIGVLSAIVLALGSQTYTQLDRQRKDPTDSALWSIFQTSLEFDRLNSAYAQFRVDNSEANINALKKRFDIFFSRVNILKSSNAFSLFRGKGYYEETSQALSGFVQRMASLIDHGEYDKLRTDEVVITEFENLSRSIATFVASAVQTQAIWDSEDRAAQKRLLLIQLLASGLLLLAFMYFAYVVLQQRNQALAREREIISRRDMLRATVNSSLDGVLIVDARGRIVEVNDAAATMFGYSPEEMVAQEMAPLVVPERLRAAHQTGMTRYATTGIAKVIGRRVELDGLRKDGSEFPIELSISSSGRGNDQTFVAFMRDISDRRLAEQSLQASKERAEAGDRAKAQFLASISHEMRTPLTGVLGALELLSGTNPTDLQRRYLQTAERSGHALFSVISDVLDLSRLDAGRFEIESEPVDPLELVDDVLEITAKLAEERGNSIRASVDPQIPSGLLGDPSRIRQVLLNLVTNAVKFTYNGTVEISLNLLALARHSADLEFAVADTGPGIAEADRSRLFRSFSQLSPNGKNAVVGSGLGLAISKRIIDMMGGTIGFESEEGRGSRFWFRLQLQLDAELAPSEAGGLDGRLQPSMPSPLSVLIIDDNETVRSIVSGQLGSRGHSVETADGAARGINMMNSSNYDVVILDISMPGIDGFEALKIIRALPGSAGRTPVIALTANALKEDRERCLAAGFDQFLTKPVRTDELIKVVSAATSPSREVTRSEEVVVENAGREPLFVLDELRQQFVTAAPADLRRIVERFGMELDQQLALLKTDGSEISPHHLRRIVHVLAGSSSMIGARRLALLARDLDALANRHEETELLGSVQELVNTIGDTRVAVDAASLELSTGAS